MEHSELLNKIDFIGHGFYNAVDSADCLDPILMNQVHSPDALFIQKAPVEAPMVDALITNKKGLKLTVKTADCAPVLIAAPKARLIAAVHAGWRGAFQGIIENTVLQLMRMGANPQDMVAAVGPHIQKQSFEADEPMCALFAKTEHRFFEQKDDTHFLFDFHNYVLHRLNRAGIEQIDSIMIDTYTNPLYNSYRRDALNPARQYSAIWIKD